jgi:hypothetical protein
MRLETSTAALRNAEHLSGGSGALAACSYRGFLGVWQRGFYRGLSRLGPNHEPLE